MTSKGKLYKQTYWERGEVEVVKVGRVLKVGT